MELKNLGPKTLVLGLIFYGLDVRIKVKGLGFRVYNLRLNLKLKDHLKTIKLRLPPDVTITINETNHHHANTIPLNTHQPYTTHPR